MDLNELEKLEREIEDSIHNEMRYRSVRDGRDEYYEAIMTGKDISLKDITEFVSVYKTNHAIKRTTNVKEASDAFFHENKAYLLVNDSLNPYNNTDKLRVKRNTSDTSFDAKILDYYGKALKRIIEHLYPGSSFHSYSVEYDLDNEIVSIDTITLFSNDGEMEINDYNNHMLVMDLLGTLFDGVLVALHHENDKRYPF